MTVSDWILIGEGVLSIICGLVAVIFYGISTNLKDVTESVRDMADSVKELNTNVAVIVERVDGHEKRITRLEKD